MKSKEYLKNLRAKSIPQLNKDLHKEYDNLHKYRFAIKVRNLKNSRLIRNSRKNIARIYSVLLEKINIETNNNK